jgi:hypothetical protein
LGWAKKAEQDLGVDFMSYATEIIVGRRIRDRMQEAEGERLASAVAARPETEQPWHTRLTLAVVRRFVCAAEAS